KRAARPVATTGFRAVQRARAVCPGSFEPDRSRTRIARRRAASHGARGKRRAIPAPGTARRAIARGAALARNPPEDRVRANFRAGRTSRVHAEPAKAGPESHSAENLPDGHPASRADVLRESRAAGPRADTGARK